MIQYLTIPTVAATAGASGVTFNVNLITTTICTAPTTFDLYVNNRKYQFTTSAGGAAGTVAAINGALAAGGKPMASTVELPAGVTIANMPAIATA